MIRRMMGDTLAHRSLRITLMADGLAQLCHEDDETTTQVTG
jgi:hypothetical protein